MTAQFPDTVYYEERTFSIAGINGTGLFEPKDYALQTYGGCTACWRGYVCHYKVEADRLNLGALDLYLKDEGAHAPDLWGVTPQKSDLFDLVYRDVKHPIPYSGGLLLASGFIRSLYVHMGFHPAWKFEEVHELLFVEGKLVSAEDCSPRVAALRERITQKPIKPTAEATHEDIKKWIDDCFSQDYHW